MNSVESQHELASLFQSSSDRNFYTFVIAFRPHKFSVGTCLHPDMCACAGGSRMDRWISRFICVE